MNATKDKELMRLLVVVWLTHAIAAVLFTAWMILAGGERDGVGDWHWRVGGEEHLSPRLVGRGHGGETDLFGRL
jgi:hypothetical protein